MEVIKGLYKVKWKCTANTYVVASTYNNVEDIIRMVRQNDNRCDDITGIEEVFLPSFDSDPLKRGERVHVFYEFNIL